MTVPLTSLENTFLTPPTVAMQAAPGATSVRVSLVQTRAQALSPALAAAVTAEPITINVPDLNACPSTGCAFTVSLPNTGGAGQVRPAPLTVTGGCRPLSSVGPSH